MRPEAVGPVLFLLIVGIPLAILWAVSLADLLRRSDDDFPSEAPGSNGRLFWLFVVLLLNGIGGFFYYIMVMKPHPRRRG